jgi:hypothetical protein
MGRKLCSEDEFWLPAFSSTGVVKGKRDVAVDY